MNPETGPDPFRRVLFIAWRTLLAVLPIGVIVCGCALLTGTGSLLAALVGGIGLALLHAVTGAPLLLLGVFACVIAARLLGRHGGAIEAVAGTVMGVIVAVVWALAAPAITRSSPGENAMSGFFTGQSLPVVITWVLAGALTDAVRGLRASSARLRAVEAAREEALAQRAGDTGGAAEGCAVAPPRSVT